MTVPIHVRPSNFDQLREALRPLLDTFEHDLPTDEKWLDHAASLVYNRLASERGPWPMPRLPEPDWSLIEYTTTWGGGETNDASQRRQQDHDQWHIENPDRPCEYGA